MLRAQLVASALNLMKKAATRAAHGTHGSHQCLPSLLCLVRIAVEVLTLEAVFFSIIGFSEKQEEEQNFSEWAFESVNFLKKKKKKQQVPEKKYQV